ncbi:MAG: hypothetical protein ACYDFU_10650, partial [Nitrospirota bacterium]
MFIKKIMAAALIAGIFLFAAAFAPAQKNAEVVSPPSKPKAALKSPSKAPTARAAHAITRPRRLKRKAITDRWESLSPRE